MIAARATGLFFLSETCAAFVALFDVSRSDPRWVTLDIVDTSDICGEKPELEVA